MCVRILRRDADHIGYNRNFTIVDPGEQRTLMKRILKQLNLDPKKWNERTILGTISNAKNDLYSSFNPLYFATPRKVSIFPDF
ncbi:ATP-dependent DNA helicase PcrA [Streptococcus pneumoniae]|nr:ATP-dependent DNA helicase PcrA [Streptococcus pneumoniae]